MNSTFSLDKLRYNANKPGFGTHLRDYTTEVNTSLAAWSATGSRALRLILDVAMPVLLLPGGALRTLHSQDIVFLIVFFLVCGHALASVLDTWDARHQIVLTRLRELDEKFYAAGRANQRNASTPGHNERVMETERECSAKLYSIKAYRAGLETL